MEKTRFKCKKSRFLIRLERIKFLFSEFKLTCKNAAYECKEDHSCARDFIENTQEFCPGKMNVLVTDYLWF